MTRPEIQHESKYIYKKSCARGLPCELVVILYMCLRASSCDWVRLVDVDNRRSIILYVKAIVESRAFPYRLRAGGQGGDN